MIPHNEGDETALKDVRSKAEEKARQRLDESGFLTERARAKEALRAEVNTYTGDNVHKIVASAQSIQEDRILRVAAYCRVSTDDIDQLLSIELQKNNYRDMICANPKWKYVGTYVDTIFRQTDSVGDGSIATALIPHVCYLQSLLVCHGNLQSKGLAFTFHWRSEGGFDEAEIKKVGLQFGQNRITDP